MCNEEDAAFADCILRVINATDHYLTDHSAVVLDAQTNAYHHRLLHSYLQHGHGEDIIVPTPRYLTPDIDRGVKYTDVLLDMKGKRSLEAWRPEPSVEYAEDSFSLNEDNSVSNMAVSKPHQTDRELIYLNTNILKIVSKSIRERFENNMTGVRRSRMKNARLIRK